MKKYLFILLFFGISLGAFAQAAQFTPDVEAKNILDKTAQALQRNTGIQATFTLTIDNRQTDQKQSFDGTLWLKGNKFKLAIDGIETYYDGKTQWVYLKDSEEVNITEPSEEEVQMINPAVIFELYKKGGNYRFVGEKKDIKQRNVYEIELLSPDKKSDIQKIIAQINKSDYMPVMFRIFYKNNLQNIIYINSYKTNQTLPDSNFIFDKKKFPDVEIIDLR